MDNLRRKAGPDTLIRVEPLTTTLRGHQVPLVTITSKLDNAVPIRDRKLVFLTARVHPGETNASWIMKGTMEQLVLGSDQASRDLRARTVFKIVPMLNVEGVINGW